MGLTVKVFADKVRALQDDIPQFQHHVKLLGRSHVDIRLELSVLRSILAYYQLEQLDFTHDHTPILSSTDLALLEMFEQLHELLNVRRVFSILILKGYKLYILSKYFQEYKFFLVFSRFCIIRNNHLRIQAWDFTLDNYPDLTQGKFII